MSDDNRNLEQRLNGVFTDLTAAINGLKHEVLEHRNGESKRITVLEERQSTLVKEVSALREAGTAQVAANAKADTKWGMSGAVANGLIRFAFALVGGGVAWIIARSIQ